MISYMITRLVILVCGNLYPAYASYKAVRTKNVKEYVNWMMYWIVYALFTCAETFTDLLLAFWFPFYYELKLVFLIWILSPYTNGSSLLYRKFVHPKLKEREQEIDEVLAHAKEQGCSALRSWGTKGATYVKSAIMQTAIKGGGGIINHLRKSCSLTDLVDTQGEQILRSNGLLGLGRLDEELDAVDSGARIAPDAPKMRYPVILTSRRSGSISGPMELYFSEADLDISQRAKLRPRLPISFIQSCDDISSGYSSTDALYTASAASTPSGDPDLNDVFLQTSFIEPPVSKLRKSSRTSCTNLLPAKPVSEDETSTSAAECKIAHQHPSKEMALPSSLLSQILLAKFREHQPLKEGLCWTEVQHSPLAHYIDSNAVCPIQFISSDGETVCKELKSKQEKKNIDKDTSSTNGIQMRKLSQGKPDVSAAIESEEKDSLLGLRAGRYGKLRAPCPPLRQSSESESMSACETGSVVNARMSLVSSKNLSGSIDILVESDVYPQ